MYSRLCSSAATLDLPVPASPVNKIGCHRLHVPFPFRLSWSRREPGEILRQPKNEVVIDCDRFSPLEQSPPLACATSTRQISSFGIEPLGRSILIKETNGGNTCLGGTSGDQLLCRVH